MTLLQWVAVGGVMLLLAVLFLLAWAYATGKLKDGPNEPPIRSRWLPHAVRMKPLGHGIYRAQDERRTEGQERGEKR